MDPAKIENDFWLFREELTRYDPVYLKNMIKSEPQIFEGQVAKIYSRRFEGDQPYPVQRMQLITAGSGWGNIGVEEGEDILVFMRSEKNGYYYEKSWHGHFVIKEINQVLHAISPWRLLGTESSPRRFKPDYLFDAAFELDGGFVAMDFQLFEKHLLDEISRIEA